MTSALRVERHPPVVGYAALWFGVLGGPMAWSLLSIANYSLVAQSCQPESIHLAHPLFSSVRTFEGVLALVALVIAVAALVTAVRSRVASDRADVPHDAVWSRVHFMALFGIVASALFVNAIILHGLAVVLIPVCV